MRYRYLIPCALLVTIAGTSCSNFRSLASPNRIPIYRAQVVGEPGTQMVAERSTSIPAANRPSLPPRPVSLAQQLPSIRKTPTPAPTPSLSNPTRSAPRVIATSSSPPASPRPPTPSVQQKSSQVVRTTAYTHTEADSLQYGLKNAAGGNLKYGRVRSAAADWSVYPVGTIFKMDGDPNVYEIDDYGSALVGSKTIDIYKPNRSSMNQWGVRHVPIKVLRWGSFQKSLEILEPRTGKASHVREMVKSIRSKGL